MNLLWKKTSLVYVFVPHIFYPQFTRQAIWKHLRVYSDINDFIGQRLTSVLIVITWAYIMKYLRSSAHMTVSFQNFNFLLLAKSCKKIFWKFWDNIHCMSVIYFSFILYLSFRTCAISKAYQNIAVYQRNQIKLAL